ncbi:MFS transporter [uncultured Fibrella sp.]|uniref:MFS transporter n=1 Tax=uncultured Fibrella sp. TaxID=1284596 RepID=UPI0035C99C8C
MPSQLPFYEWTPAWLRDAGIVLLLIGQSFVFGLSADMLPELRGELGTITENIKFIIQANAIGFLCTLPLYYRLRSFLRKKDLLLGALILQLVLALLAGQIVAVPLLCLLNFGIGFTKCIVTLDMIGLLMAWVNPTNNRAVFYGVYYTLSKPIALLADLSLAWVIHQYNWHYAAWLSLPAVLLSIGLTGLLFHGGRLVPKVPLANIDWIGALLLTLTCGLLAFTADFGQYYDWFNSPIIILATGTLLLCAGLFVFWEARHPQPYWNLKIISQYRQIRVGVVLMLVLCLFIYSSSLAKQYALSLVGSDAWYLSKLTLVTLLAYLISFPLSGWLLNRRVSYRLLLGVGFVCYCLSYAYIIVTVSPNIDPLRLYPFYFLQGIAYGIILTTLSTFASSNVEAADNPHRAFASVAARSVIGLVTVGSIWDNALYHRSAINRNALLNRLTAANEAFNQQVKGYAQRFMQMGMDKQQAQAAATQLMTRKVDAQALLLTDKDLFASLLLLALVVALCVPFLRSLEMHNRPKTNEYPLV